MKLLDYFHPHNFECSPKFHAILAYILGVEWTEPALASLSITSDGYLVSGDYFLGSADDLERNINGAMQFVEMPKEDCEAFWKLVWSRVDDWRNRV